MRVAVDHDLLVVEQVLRDRLTCNATATGPASGDPGPFGPNSVSVGADRVRGVHPSDALFPDESEEPTESTDAARRDALLSSLNPAQREAVLHAAPVLRIIAGAGSGKTRVHLSYRCRSLKHIDPRRVLAVTFTQGCRHCAPHRPLGLRGGINAGTFHAIAYTQLRQRWEERGINPPELLDRKVGFVARLMRGGSSTLPLDVVSEIEWAKARMISAGDYPAQAAIANRRVPIAPEAVADIYARYEETKLGRRMVDFDDLLRLATRDIEADPEYAAARRWRFRHLFVDEFQDVNPLQFRLLQAWVGPQVDLWVVGDPNQAIYAWNGPIRATRPLRSALRRAATVS
jgi:DNA helicase-2/ATP-dependent DNA helicase PcrA